MPPALRAYLGATYLVPLFARRHLWKRLNQGKEIPARWIEKLGQPSAPRPDGKLIWLNAVGLGEVLSLRGLIGAMSSLTDAHFLVTSTTKTSAEVLAKNMPPRTVHQFLPLDSPRYRQAFLDHWRPDVCIWAEQEIWPGFVVDLTQRGIPQAMVAARMTADRFVKNERWQSSLAHLYGQMALITAQDQSTADRLSRLGAEDVRVTGSLKPAGPALGCDVDELATVSLQLKDRFTWIAAPTHPVDEALAVAAHQELRKANSNALLIIAPRDPKRDLDFNLPTAIRSKGDLPGPDDAIYLADTYGDLGLMYRLAEAALIGGTQDATEGHSPWEAAALNTAIFHGPRTANFGPDFERLDAEGAATLVSNSTELALHLQGDLKTMANKASEVRLELQASVAALAQDLVVLA